MKYKQIYKANVSCQTFAVKKPFFLNLINPLFLFLFLNPFNPMTQWCDVNSVEEEFKRLIFQITQKNYTQCNIPATDGSNMCPRFLFRSSLSCRNQKQTSL